MKTITYGATVLGLVIFIFCITSALPVIAQQPPRSKRATALEREYADLEVQAAQLAAQLREMQTHAGENSPALREIQQRLRTTLNAAFDSRQKMQRAELEQLTRRLDSARATIETREERKDSIVSKRYEELLHPQLGWTTRLTEPLANSDPSPPYTAARMKLNFESVPWSDVLQWLADVADKNVMGDEMPPGTFTYRSDKHYTLIQALTIINRVLKPRGYRAELVGEFLAIVSIDGESRAIPPTTNSSGFDIRSAVDLRKSIDDAKARRNAAWTVLAQSKTQLRAAQDRAKHSRQLHQKGYVSKSQLEADQSVVEMADMKIELAVQAVRDANQSVVFAFQQLATQIRVLEIDVELGQLKLNGLTSQAERSGNPESSEREIERTQLELDQIHELLALYRKVEAGSRASEVEDLEALDLELDTSEDDPPAGKRVVQAVGLIGVPVTSENLGGTPYRGGIRVTGLLDGSAADHAGLRLTDIVVGLDRWETKDLDDLLFVLQQADVSLKTGIKVTYIRDGRVHTTVLQ